MTNDYQIGKDFEQLRQEIVALNQRILKIEDLLNISDGDLDGDLDDEKDDEEETSR